MRTFKGIQLVPFTIVNVMQFCSNVAYTILATLNRAEKNKVHVLYPHFAFPPYFMVILAVVLNLLTIKSIATYITLSPRMFYCK